MQSVIFMKAAEFLYSSVKPVLHLYQERMTSKKPQISDYLSLCIICSCLQALAVISKPCTGLTLDGAVVPGK